MRYLLPILFMIGCAPVTDAEIASVDQALHNDKIGKGKKGNDDRKLPPGSWDTAIGGPGVRGGFGTSTANPLHIDFPASHGGCDFECTAEFPVCCSADRTCALNENGCARGEVTTMRAGVVGQLASDPEDLCSGLERVNLLPGAAYSIVFFRKTEILLVSLAGDQGLACGRIVSGQGLNYRAEFSFVDASFNDEWSHLTGGKGSFSLSRPSLDSVDWTGRLIITPPEGPIVCPCVNDGWNDTARMMTECWGDADYIEPGLLIGAVGGSNLNIFSGVGNWQGTSGFVCSASAVGTRIGITAVENVDCQRRIRDAASLAGIQCDDPIPPCECMADQGWVDALHDVLVDPTTCAQSPTSDGDLILGGVSELVGVEGTQFCITSTDKFPIGQADKVDCWNWISESALRPRYFACESRP